MRYLELHEKHSNVDGDIIMYKLPKDRAVRAAWINPVLKGRKQVIQEGLQTYVPACLIN